MTRDDLILVSQQLAAELHDNLGNRLTVALANGLLQQVQERCSRLIDPADAQAPAGAATTTHEPQEAHR